MSNPRVAIVAALVAGAAAACIDWAPLPPGGDADAGGDADGDGAAGPDADALGDGEADGDADAEVDNACSVAIDCFVSTCGSDDVCILLCLRGLCEGQHAAALAVLSCANDECGDPCQEPGEPRCSACIESSCAADLTACRSSSC